jgi:hypothetical protein
MSDSWTNNDGMVVRYGPRLKCDEYPEIPEPDPAECPTTVYEQQSKWVTPEGTICLGFGPHEASTSES